MIDIYMVTHNRPLYLYMALDAIAKNTSREFFKLYVIANTPCDETLRMIRTESLCRGVIDHALMVPFAQRVDARDELIDRFPPTQRFTMYIDDDIVLPSGWLTEAMYHFDSEPKLVAFSYKISETDRPDPNHPLTPSCWKDCPPLQWSKVRRVNPNTGLNETESVGGVIITPTCLFKKIGWKFRRDAVYCRNVRKKGFLVGFTTAREMRHIGYNSFYDYPGYEEERDEFFSGYKEYYAKEKENSRNRPQL